MTQNEAVKDKHKYISKKGKNILKTQYLVCRTEEVGMSYSSPGFCI